MHKSLRVFYVAFLCSCFPSGFVLFLRIVNEVARCIHLVIQEWISCVYIETGYCVPTKITDLLDLFQSRLGLFV